MLVKGSLAFGCCSGADFNARHSKRGCAAMRSVRDRLIDIVEAIEKIENGLYMTQEQS